MVTAYFNSDFRGYIRIAITMENAMFSATMNVSTGKVTIYASEFDGKSKADIRTKLSGEKNNPMLGKWEIVENPKIAEADLLTAFRGCSGHLTRAFYHCQKKGHTIESDVIDKINDIIKALNLASLADVNFALKLASVSAPAEATTENTAEATTENTAEATAENTAEATAENTAEATAENTTEATVSNVAWEKIEISDINPKWVEDIIEVSQMENSECEFEGYTFRWNNGTIEKIRTDVLKNPPSPFENGTSKRKTVKMLKPKEDFGFGNFSKNWIYPILEEKYECGKYYIKTRDNIGDVYKMAKERFDVVNIYAEPPKVTA